jgi:hypothetical protein
MITGMRLAENLYEREIKKICLSCETGNLKGLDLLGDTGTEGKVLFGILQYSSVQ